MSWPQTCTNLDYLPCQKNIQENPGTNKRGVFPGFAGRMWGRGRKKKAMSSGDVIFSENNILGDLNTTVPRIKKENWWSWEMDMMH